MTNKQTHINSTFYPPRVHGTVQSKWYQLIILHNLAMVRAKSKGTYRPTGSLSSTILSNEPDELLQWLGSDNTSSPQSVFINRSITIIYVAKINLLLALLR